MRENVSNMVALLLKAVVFTVITAIFFGVYSIQHPWLYRAAVCTYGSLRRLCGWKTKEQADYIFNGYIIGYNRRNHNLTAEHYEYPRWVQGQICICKSACTFGGYGGSDCVYNSVYLFFKLSVF